MQVRTILLWIIIAGLLGGVVVISRQSTVKAHTQEQDSWRSLPIDAARVVALVRTVEGLDDQRVERAGEGETGWIVYWGGDGHRQSWAGDERRARAGIRNLATQRIAISEDDAIADLSGTIRVIDADGKQTDIAFGSTPAGGYIPIRVDERDNEGIVQSRWFGRVESELKDAMITTGFLPWRSEKLFAVTPSQVEEVSLQAGASTVTLSREIGGWMISKPFQARASDSTADNLVGSLLELSALSFVERVDKAIQDGFETPIATVSVQADSEAAVLVIGGQADMDGEVFFAQISTNSGSSVIQIKGKDLSSLTPTPEAYISKVPSDTSPSDISRISITGKDGRTRFEAVRKAGDWIVDGAIATPQYVQALTRLVDVTCTKPATGIRVSSKNDDDDSSGAVHLFNQSNTEIDMFTFSLGPTDDGLRLVLSKDLSDVDRVNWYCTSDEAVGTGAWLTAAASRRSN